MTVVAEPILQAEPTVRTYASQTAHVRRQVQIVLDACCEVAPAEAAQLGVRLIARQAKIDGRVVTLDADQTLHYSCWPQPLRRIVPAPSVLGDLAQAYGDILAQDMSVLALHLPSALDSAARVALSARSIMLAGQRSSAAKAPRIAVYELTQTGAGFVFLVEAAARAAADGMSLQQVLTLLDRLQAATHSYYLTGARGPVETMCQPRTPGVARMGNEQLWELDRSTGLFACRARSWNLVPTLFADDGPLGGTPNVIWTQQPALLARLNAARARLQLPPLDAQPHGASLGIPFPHGCVELAMLPEQSHVDQIIEVIRRIDRTAAPAPVATRRRGAIL